MSLCSRCQNFDIQAFGKVFPLRGYAFSDVIAGSSTGCNFCSLLMDAIGSHKICDESGRGWWSSITQPKKLSDMYNKWLQSRIYIHPEGPKQVHFWASKVTTTPETLGTGMGIVDLCCVVGRDLSRTGSVNDSMTIFHAGADPGNISSARLNVHHRLT